MIHKFDLKIHVFDYTKYRVKVKKQGKERNVYLGYQSE